jgi:hypothetical protein
VFWPSLRVDRVGGSMPAKRSIRHAITNWTAHLDPDEVASADLTDESAWAQFQFGDWVISLRPGVWQPRFRGCPQNRFIGMRTGIGGFLHDVPKLRNAMTHDSQGQALRSPRQAASRCGSRDQRLCRRSRSRGHSLRESASAA